MPRSTSAAGSPPGSAPRNTPRTGRRRATSADRIGAIGIALFTERGFEETSVDEIAETAGIARRTFFRYFPSKNAVPWGDFAGHLERMRAGLDELPADIDLAEGLRQVLIRFNTFPAAEAATHRKRMALILEAPALQAYSMLMYTDWRQAIAEYVARRLALQADDHLPQSIAWQMLGVALSAYENWLRDETADLHVLLDEGMAVLDEGLGAVETVAAPPGPGDSSAADSSAGERRGAEPGQAWRSAAYTAE